MGQHDETKSTRRLRRAFIAMDVLFFASWSVWVPSFLLFLEDVFGANSANSVALVSLSLAFLLLFETTTGSIADLMKGSSAFFIATGTFAAGNFAYALIFMVADENRFSLAILAEALAASGLSMFSGAFDRWYVSTLELAGAEHAQTDGMRLQRRWRNFTIMLAGAAGLFAYDRFRVLNDAVEGEAMGSVKLSTLICLPYLIAGVLGVVALVVAAGLTRTLRLDRDDMLLAGGRRAGDTAVGFAEWWRMLRQTTGQALLFVFRVPQIQATVLLNVASQSAVTVLAFYAPLHFSVASKEGWLPWAVGFWFAIRLARWSGSFLSTWCMRPLALLSALLEPRVKDRRLGAAAVALTLIAGMLAGCAAVIHTDAVAWMPRSSVIIVTGALCSFLLGSTEAAVDAAVADFAPRDLLSSLYSYKSMLSAGVVALMLLPCSYLATYFGRGGEQDFAWLLFAIAVVVGAMALGAQILAALPPLFFHSAFVPRWALAVNVLFSLLIVACVGWIFPGVQRELIELRRLVDIFDTTTLQSGGAGTITTMVNVPASATALFLGFVLFALPVLVAYGYVTRFLVSGVLESETLASGFMASLRAANLSHSGILNPLRTQLRTIQLLQTATKRPKDPESIPPFLKELEELTSANIKESEARAAKFLLQDGVAHADALECLQIALRRAHLERQTTEPLSLVGAWLHSNGGLTVPVCVSVGVLPEKFAVNPGQSVDVLADKTLLVEALVEAVTNAIHHSSPPADSGPTAVANVWIEAYVCEATVWFFVRNGGDWPAGETMESLAIRSARDGKLGLTAMGLLTRNGTIGYFLDEGIPRGAIVRIVCRRTPSGAGILI